jgi:energy-coupling factor transporter ATP-binding protein EcfA2
MQLKKIDYHEFTKGGISYWELSNLTLDKINLLVGKNATGKSRTINVIKNLGDLLIGMHPDYPHTAYAYIELIDSSDVYKYTLEISSYKVVFECLEVNNERKIERGKDGLGKIFAEKENKMIDFQVSEKQPVVLLRQDAIQHPYIRKFLDWADGLRVYSFGGTLGRELGFPMNADVDQHINLRDAQQATGLFIKGQNEYGDVFSQEILSAMGKVGYNITKIWTNPMQYPSQTNRFVLMICVFEHDWEGILFQPLMSQGMFRALSLIIQITYNVLNNSPTTILIDDIGEGLDFDRSSSLIKLLIEMVKESDIQLIMSTNDRYVMNNVPLEYWQVIQRNGGECKVYNYQNSKEKFDEFKYMGLNNFDFLATDYLNSEWQKT